MQEAFGVMFHHFKGGEHPDGQGAMSSDELEQMIQYLGRENILSPDEWAQRLQQNTLQPQHRCLTFDDNLKCQYDVAKPVLDKHGLKAFWFIYTSPYENELERLEVFRYFRSVKYETIEEFYAEFFEQTEKSLPEIQMREKLENFNPESFYSYYSECPFYSLEDWQYRYLRDHVLKSDQYLKIMEGLMDKKGLDPSTLKDKLWMSQEDVSSLANQGHWVGMHSHKHPTLLTSLDYADQVNEYKKNAEWVEKITGKKPKAVSHPCNSYDQGVLSLMEEMGIQIGFRAHLKEDETKHDRLALPREDHANLLREMRESM